MQPKVPNKDLLNAGLALMAQNGMPLERTESKGRAMIYRTAAGESIRVRTCNDHVLVAVASSPNKNATLNIEGTDKLLVVMPEVARMKGPVVAFLVPTDVAVEAVRSTHLEWLASNPATHGKNQTWNIWFDEDAPSKANGYMKKWAQYRLKGAASTDIKARISSDSNRPGSLGDVISDAKRRIAEAAGVPETAVKITLDLT